jgi:hypothetical protein
MTAVQDSSVQAHLVNLVVRSDVLKRPPPLRLLQRPQPHAAVIKTWSVAVESGIDSLEELINVVAEERAKAHQREHRVYQP